MGLGQDAIKLGNENERKEKCTLIELVVKMLENDYRIVRLETKALTIGTTER